MKQSGLTYDQIATAAGWNEETVRRVWQGNRERTLRLPAPGGQGPGSRGMANICEPLINVVTEDKPKVLFSPARALGLGQKARGQI